MDDPAPRVLSLHSIPLNTHIHHTHCAHTYNAHIHAIHTCCIQASVQHYHEDISEVTEKELTDTFRVSAFDVPGQILFFLGSPLHSLRTSAPH